MSQKTAKPRYTAARPVSSERGGSRRTLWLVIGLVLALAIGVSVGLFVANAGTSDSDRAVAEMLRAAARRDAVQITQLTSMARTTKGALTPVVVGLGAAAPGDGTDGQAATDTQLAEWKKILEQERQRYEETVSGSTGTNVARNALRTSVNMLFTALDTYTVAVDLPAERRSSVIDLAGRQRLLAIDTWSVAATQLDQLNVDSGNGHQHVYLTDPEGAMMDDGVPEGSQG